LTLSASTVIVAGHELKAASPRSVHEGAARETREWGGGIVRIGVLLLSDVRLHREALERALREVDTVQVVATAASIAEAVEKTRTLAPSVALLDVARPSVFGFARQIAHVMESTRVVVLGMPEDESVVISCAEVGIAGYVPREASIVDLVASIESAARGEVRCSPRIAGELFRRIAALSKERRGFGRPAALTARETQILHLLEQGLSNKMISRDLCIELATVKNHVHSVLAKLGLQRRAQVASLARRRTGS
jgi:DNA-binding NarL/FixJ family response regulator